MATRVRVAVVGAGAWGLNHVRAFSRAKGAELVLVCDPAAPARARAQAIAPRVRVAADLEAALAAVDVDAVVLATPAPMHGAQAQLALAAGKHVLVEKPLAMTSVEAQAVAEAAARVDRVLMVGHLMLYHPVTRKIKELIRSGDLGTIFYMYALRVNLGRLRRDENALWSLGPHDVSMILDLLGQKPVSVSARGGAY